MRLFVMLVVAALVLVAAGPANADPVPRFETFVIDCGAYGTVEIVSKPGASQVVAVSGAPSNSVALLVAYEFWLDGQFFDFTAGAQYQPPGVQNHQEPVVCYDTTVQAPDYFKAWVLFTPVRPGK
jgi:hypothetical protein